MSVTQEKLIVPDDRQLTTDERQLIAWLIDHGSEEAAAYRGQLSRVHVVSKCGCGCPSVDLALTGSSKRSGPSAILADVTGRSPEGVLVGVMLHGREGELSELEVYSKEGQVSSFRLPQPADLESA
jgi:hypothetical protein